MSSTTQQWSFCELLFLPLALLPIIPVSAKVFFKEKLSCRKAAEEAEVISAAKQRGPFPLQPSKAQGMLVCSGAPTCSSAAHTSV